MSDNLTYVSTRSSFYHKKTNPWQTNQSAIYTTAVACLAQWNWAVSETNKPIFFFNCLCFTDIQPLAEVKLLLSEITAKKVPITAHWNISFGLLLQVKWIINVSDRDTACIHYCQSRREARVWTEQRLNKNNLPNTVNDPELIICVN